jgi:hypothetical protein
VDYKQILKVILDIGEQMINSGAEIGRVEDSMYRLCRSYGFVRVNCWVISSNIQATVETPDGDIFTQIRHVPGGEMNFDRLDYLNTLKSPTNTTDISDNGLASYDKALSLMPENPRDSFYHMAGNRKAGHCIVFSFKVTII